MAVETYAQAKASNQLNDAAIQFFLTMISGQNKDGSAFALPTTATLTPTASSTATLTNVNDSATSVTVLALNAQRKGATFFNDSTSDLYLKFGATASATSFTVKIPAGQYYELPTTSVYTGIIDGIWTADSTGAVRVTELTA